MKRKERGVTLIALVVTIVVLLILASIGIGAITSDNGVIKQSNETKQSAERESIIEKIEADLYTEKTKTGKTPSKNDLKELIKEKDFGTVNEDDSFTSKIGNYKIEFEEIEGWENQYKEVAYLESTGTQYIDTEFISNQDSGYEIKFMVTDGENPAGIYGARSSATSNNFSLGVWKSQNCIFTDYNSYLGGRVTTKYDNNIHIFKTNKNEIIMDDKKSITNNYMLFSTGETNYIFRIRGRFGIFKGKNLLFKIV